MDTNIEAPNRDTDLVYCRVRKVISEVLHCPEEKITRTSRYIDDLRADSLDNILLVSALEKEFERDILEESDRGVITVGDTVDFICHELSRGRESLPNRS